MTPITISRMTKKTSGYHNFMLRIPDALWQAIQAESERSGRSASRIMNEAVGKYCGLKKDEIPPPPRPGRPLKPK